MARSRPEHDPEKWIPIFRQDHAQTKSGLRTGALVAIATDERAAARIIARRPHAARRVVIVARRWRRILRLHSTIARRNRRPAAGLFQIAAALIPAIAARTLFALRADGRTGAGADDGADRSAAAATQRLTDDGARSAAEQRAAECALLRRRLLQRRADGKGHQHREREFRDHVSSPAVQRFARYSVTELRHKFASARNGAKEHSDLQPVVGPEEIRGWVNVG
jgi:hypothetical protein